MDNCLNNITILRFTKAFKGGGGIETHLDALDKILLARNKIKIIKTYFETELKEEKYREEFIGRGNLIEIPIYVNWKEIQNKSNNLGSKKSKLLFLKAFFREIVIYNPLLYRIFFRKYLKKNYSRIGLLPIKNAAERFRKIHQEYNINLLVMHYLGTDDSAEVIEEAKKLGIPYIYMNHFSNEYFNNISIREQLIDAAAIAGVTNVGFPKRLRNQFYYVSNGIDLKVFDPLQKHSTGIETDLPIIIYPARIIPNKGQTDLIKAYVNLRNKELRAKIVFAGRIVFPEYYDKLNQLVKENRLEDDVIFLGELKRGELLDWYGGSSILAFPTYHDEGLPRVLMEAQAMEVPPVAYIIGGTPGVVQDGKTGFLVKKGDVKTFTKRLEELLTNEEKRKKMGQEGRKFIQREFSLDALAERHEKLYLSVLNRKSKL